jgi:hypothetical protein
MAAGKSRDHGIGLPWPRIRDLAAKEGGGRRALTQKFGSKFDSHIISKVSIQNVTKNLKIYEHFIKCNRKMWTIWNTNFGVLDFV